MRWFLLFWFATNASHLFLKNICIIIDSSLANCWVESRNMSCCENIDRIAEVLISRQQLMADHYCSNNMLVLKEIFIGQFQGKYFCRISAVRLFANSKKIDDVAVNKWMPVPNDWMVTKPKIRGCPDLWFGVGEL